MLARVRSLVALASVTLLACSSPRDAAPARERRPASVSTPTPTPAPTPRAVAVPGESPGERPTVQASKRTAAPAHRCLVRADQELASGERALAGYVEGAAIVVTLEAGGRTLSLWTQAADETLVRRASLPLEASAQRATLHCAETCELALVDERARLLAFGVRGERLAAVGVLASGLDRRFAPALSQHGRRVLYAYTSAVDEVMHTWLLVRAQGETTPARDLTPAGHGAAAASFVLGARPPILVVIDARAGVSPLLEIGFDDAAAPKVAQVRTPVSQPYTPPLLQAVQHASGEVELFYTAIGKLAMTAVGRVWLRVAKEPTALLPSRGYGELTFSVAVGGGTALLALETPTGSAPTAKRTLALKLTDGVSTHDALTIDAGGEAARPSLASAGAGEYLLAYVRDGVVHAASLGCAP